MRWKIALGAAILVVGLYLVLSPYIETGKTDLTAGKSAEEIISAIKEEKGINSYKYISRVEAGDYLTANLSGLVKVDSEEEMLDLNWESHQGNGKASVYFNGKNLLIFHPLKNRWLTPEEDRAAGSLIKIFTGQMTLIDPYKSIQNIDLEQVKTENTGQEKVAGRSVTVLEVKPGEAAAQWFSDLIPPQLIGAKVSELKQVYWVDDQDLRIHKYLLTANIKVLGLQLLQIQVYSDIKDFNATKIKVPDNLKKRLEESGL